MQRISTARRATLFFRPLQVIADEKVRAGKGKVGSRTASSRKRSCASNSVQSRVYHWRILTERHIYSSGRDEMRVKMIRWSYEEVGNNKSYKHIEEEIESEGIVCISLQKEDGNALRIYPHSDGTFTLNSGNEVLSIEPISANQLSIIPRTPGVPGQHGNAE